MRIIRESNEDEMLLEYLKCEVGSKRFGDRLKKTLDELNLSKELITDANLNSTEENALRRKIMGKFRGYPTDDIFERFPKNIDWKYVQFEEGDIDKIFYLNWDYWNEISDNTSKPTVAAVNIRNGIEYYNIPNERFFEGLADLEKGDKFNPIIVLTYKGEKCVVIEGHSRMTIYGLRPEFFTGTFGYVGFCTKDEMEYYDPRMV